MTKVKSLSFFLAALLTFSCNTADINEEITNTEFRDNVQIESPKKENPHQNRNDYRTLSEIEDLELTMQWVSYMTAQVLLEDAGARRQFEQEVVNTDGANAFALENLIGHDTPFDAFRERFKAEFLFHYNYNNNDGYSPCFGSGGKPRGRPTPPTSAGDFILDEDILFNRYVDYLLVDNCLEYFLPNDTHIMSLNRLPGPYLTSAHPLDDSTENLAFMHNTSCLVEQDRVGSITSGYIIIVRPFRRSTVCDYDEYAVLDFSTFLN